MPFYSNFSGFSKNFLPQIAMSYHGKVVFDLLKTTIQFCQSIYQFIEILQFIFRINIKPTFSTKNRANSGICANCLISQLVYFKPARTTLSGEQHVC